MKENFTIEWTDFGALIICPPGDGLRLSEMASIVDRFNRGAVLASGIAHHYQKFQKKNAVLAVAFSVEVEKLWEEVIRRTLSGLDPQEQWWYGPDVGKSSAAIFGVFCRESFREEVFSFADGSTPRDADDFQRCFRLLQMFPAWRHRLNELAHVYPDGGWPYLAANWKRLELIDNPAELNAILRDPSSHLTR